jgi:regulator of replication initiation timing
MKYQVVVREKTKIARTCGHTHRTPQAGYACQRDLYRQHGWKWVNAVVEDSNGVVVDEYDTRTREEMDKDPAVRVGEMGAEMAAMKTQIKSMTDEAELRGGEVMSLRERVSELEASVIAHRTRENVYYAKIKYLELQKVIETDKSPETLAKFEKARVLMMKALNKSQQAAPAADDAPAVTDEQSAKEAAQ